MGPDSYHWVGNYGIVSPGILYRGAHPGIQGLQHLKDEKHVRTIVDLREEAKGRALLDAKAIGLYYVNIGIVDNEAPTTDNVKQFLSLANDPYYVPLFVGCQKGCGRTGTMVCCYRMAVCKWKLSEAIEEAQLYSRSLLGWHPFRALTHVQLEFLHRYAEEERYPL